MQKYGARKIRRTLDRANTKAHRRMRPTFIRKTFNAIDTNKHEMVDSNFHDSPKWMRQ